MNADWVECRSDHDYIGRPLAFTWQGNRFEIADVIIQNQTPLGYQFQVRTTDDEIFELDYDTHTDQWSVQQL